MKTLYDLMLQVSRHLTGQNVNLILADKKSIGAAGVVSKNLAGRVVISLANDAFQSGSDEDLYCLLHEIAHAKLHGQKFKRSNPLQLPAWKTPNPLLESEAETQAKAWLNWSEKHAISSLENGLSGFENKLYALLKY